MAKKTAKVTLKLTEPFQYGEELIEELHLKRPSADDISHLVIGADNQLGDLIKIGLQCAALPPTPVTMKLLSGKDGIALANKVSDFL